MRNGHEVIHVLSRVVMTDEDLSSYELKRLERIKENRALVSLLL